MLIFDKQRESYQIVGYKQFDSLEPLRATFLNNGQPISLIDYYVRFECKKPDGNIVIDDENINIRNVCEIEMLLNEQVAVVNGNVKCQFVLVRKNDERQTSTFDFEMNIQQSVIAINGYSHSTITIAERLNKDIPIAKKLHEDLTKDIADGNKTKQELIEKTTIAKTTINTLVEKTAEGNNTIDGLVEKDAIAKATDSKLNKTIDNANETNRILNESNSEADTTNARLQMTIDSGKDSIDKINATGNKSLIIGASQFINNEYTWKHDMNSEDLHVTFEDLATKLPLLPDYQRIDKNNILIRNSAESPNIKVVLSASYYQGNALFGTNVEEFASDSIGVNTKKVRLKDGNGIVENPVTDSDAVFMPDGTTKLTKKIDDISASLEQINQQKANEVEVRKKNIPITEYDISDTLKQQINGNAPILQTIGDGTISPLKTTFIKRGINLFNKNDVVVGKYIDYSSGQILANGNYNATGYILIEPNTVYSLIQIMPIHYAFYDSNKQYIPRTINTEQPTFTSPSNARYFRGSVQSSKMDMAMMIEGNNTSVLYEEYKELLDEKFIKKQEKTMIEFNDLDFIESINIFNKNSEDVLIGKTDDGGWVAENSNYSTSGYIVVKPNTQYIINNFRFLNFYDEKKSFISKMIYGDNIIFTTSPNTKYIRFSALNTKFNDIMINKGNRLLNYKDYKLLIPNSYLETRENVPLAFLPKEIYVAVGRTIELYNNQVCINAERFNLCWKCNVGSAMKRKFTITGKTELIGDYNLILEIYNDNLDLLESISTKLKIVNSVIASAISVLPIGDSLTNAKPWLAEVSLLSNGKINYVGTRWNGFGSSYETATQKHEGRSGATAEWYTKKSVYDFETNGLTPNNPFWNPTTSKFDFGYYKTTYNINPDVVQVFLGTNGISLDPAVNVNNIKAIVDRIRENDSTIKIYIVNTIYRSNQDGIGKTLGNDGYATFKNQYKIEEDMKVFNLMKALDEAFSSYLNIHFINLALTNDSEYNFGRVEINVNPRSSIKEIMPLDSVHPQTEGYLQMADIMFSTFCGTL